MTETETETISQSELFLKEDLIKSRFFRRSKVAFL